MIDSTEPAVVCRNVIKEFGQGQARVRALRGIDLDVLPGEMTLLVGPSGCGKTTLLSVIAGILSPSQGEIRVLGTDVSRLSKSSLVQFRGHNIGFIFQQYNLLPALTAAENAAVPLVIAGSAKQPAVDKARKLLGMMGMEKRAEAMPSQLSGGEQQRVAIARALVHQPRLLVCDEPTSALDEHTGNRIMELLREVAVQPDRAVIVVTHDARVFKYGDKIAHMNDGQVVEVQSNGQRELAGHPFGV